MAATSNSGSSKMGSVECASILGLFATGDASIETAMKNGGITKIHHIDYHSTGIINSNRKYFIVSRMGAACCAYTGYNKQCSFFTTM
jgi:hypothetical protein